MGLSDTATNILPAGRLQAEHWPIGAMLLFAALSVYLLFAAQSVVQTQRQVEVLHSAVLHNAVDASVSHSVDLEDRLAEINSLIPAIRTHAPEASASADRVLNTLSQRPTADADQAVVDAQLQFLLTALDHRDGQLAAQRTQGVHMFYWAFMGLLCATAALLLRRRWSRPSALDLMLQDNLLFQHAPVALSLSDEEDRLLRVNQAFEQATGFADMELIGQPIDHPRGEDKSDEMREQLLDDGQWVGEFTFRKKDGSAWADKVMRVALGEDLRHPDGYLTMSMEPVIADDEKKLMLWQAHHDNLTKLPNSNLLSERLARALVIVQQESKQGALISIDLDNFQTVNDSVGYSSADRVLTEAAYRIVMCANETDTVARTGGDQFVMVINEIEDFAEPERIARSVIEQMAQPYFIDDRELFLTASIGIAIFPDDAKEQGELMQQADAALTNAKARGGNQVMFFEQEMNSAAARRLELETCLRRAVANGEFELFYQPVIDIARDEVYGAEALIRWHNPELGMVSPAEFIPVAEESGLIIPIGQWVVQEVQRQLTVWENSELPPLRISLNVSAKQFSQVEAAEGLLKLLKSAHSDSITVEITETALVADQSGAGVFLKGLRDAGIKIALDDFGTGYSSVGYLRNFEFDVLKIDKSFIDGLNAIRDYGLVASIVAMGRILGMRVVAEGVEESDQVLRLKQIGCDYVQGYYYAKPLKAAEFETFAQRDQGEDEDQIAI